MAKKKKRNKNVHKTNSLIHCAMSSRIQSRLLWMQFNVEPHNILNLYTEYALPISCNIHFAPHYNNIAAIKKKKKKNCNNVEHIWITILYILFRHSIRIRAIRVPHSNWAFYFQINNLKRHGFSSTCVILFLFLFFYYFFSQQNVFNSQWSRQSQAGFSLIPNLVRSNQNVL